MNNAHALQLQISKVAQYAELAEVDMRTPRTVAAVRRDNLIAAARDHSAGKPVHASSHPAVRRS